MTEPHKLTRIGRDVLRIKGRYAVTAARHATLRIVLAAVGKKSSPYPAMKEAGMVFLQEVQDRSYGLFAKDFKIPVNYDIQNPHSSYVDGVLTVTLNVREMTYEL